LRTRPPGYTQRDRGQKGGVSGAAGTLARFVTLVALAVLVPSLLAPDLVRARAHRATPDPTPQAAPSAPAASGPSPDPAPQAAVSPHPAVRSQSSHSSPVLTTSGPVPTVIVPRIVHVAAPAQRPAVSSDVTHVSPVRPNSPRHRPTVSRTPAHHTTPVVAKHVAVSFSLGFLEKYLLRLAPGASRGGDAPQRDGVLLLLASLAMGVVAVSSFALSRRLKELE
jgi:hypothetical protein